MIKRQRFEFWQHRKENIMKNKLKLIALITAALTLLFAVTGCNTSDSSKNPDSSASSKVIRIGDQANYFTAKVALDKGFFEEEFGDEYEIKLSTFTNGPAATEAFIAGEIDFALYADTPAVQALANGTDIRIISTLWDSEDCFKVIAGKDSGIDTLADIKGKKVGFEAGTNDHKILIKLLEAQGLTMNDITAINLSSSENASALISGDIDAFFGQEPNLDNIISQTGGKIVGDNSGLTMLGAYVIADNAYAQANPDITASLLKVFDKTDKWMAENVDEAAEIVAGYTGGSKDDLKKYYESREWNTIWNDELTDSINDTIQFSYDLGNIKELFDASDLVDTAYLKKAGLYQE